MLSNTSTSAGRQLLSPGKLATENAAIAPRKGSTTSTVDGASQFIPLLKWEEDRGSSWDPPSLPTLSKAIKPVPENKGSRLQVDSDASISSSSDEEFKPAARRVRRVTPLKSRRDVETVAKQEVTPQDTHKAVTSARLRLFRPGQKPQHGSTSQSASPTSMQSTDYQANVNSVAQQARGQQLKQKQAAAAAEIELDRLKGLLQREKALQASVVKGSIRLADNGARLAERLAQLDDNISRQSELVQMYAEQLGPNTAPAMQDNLSAPAFTNNISLQSVVFGDQQRHPVSSSQHMQASGHQQKQTPVSAHGDVPRQAAHRAETGQGAQPVLASRSAPSNSRPRVRPGTMDRHARSSADRRHQHSDGSHGPHGRGRAAGADSKPRQDTHSPNARKGRQKPVTDSRPNKRQKQQATSRTLQSQRQAWMDRLTADAAQEAARAEAAAWAVEYQPSWTYQDEQGSQGPFPLAELKVMLAQGRLQDSTMVHDEEAEISIRLATLIANTQRNRSTIEPLPLNASEAPGTAAAADGDAAAKAEVSQGGSQSITHQQGQPQVKQEASPSPPSQGSGSETMDIGDSDAESPPAAGPVNHMWSPQYSPAKLAELVPVRHSPAPNNPCHSGSSAVAQSHPQHGASAMNRSVEPQGPDKHLHSHPGHAYHPPHAQAMHHHQMQGSVPAGGHSFADMSREESHLSRDHAWSPSNHSHGASGQPTSPPPPPPPPSNPMHNRPYSLSYALDAAKPPHHSMPSPSKQSMEPVHQRQDYQSPDEQCMMSHHHREVGYPTAAMHAAPGHDITQSEQQLQQPHQLPYSPTRPDTCSLSHQQYSTSQQYTHLQLSSLSQHGSPPSSDWHYPPQPPRAHPHTQGTYDAPHVPDGHAHWPGHLEQGSASQGSGPKQAGRVGQHLLHDQVPQGFPATSWAQEPGAQPTYRQDLAAHIKHEPGIAAAPHSTAHPVDHAFPHAPHQVQLQPQAATVLSPELSAALAAGLLRQSLATSDQRLAKQHEHHPAQPEIQPRQLSRNDVTPALPPELSAALASGQLNFQLGRFDAASHQQQARQHAYEPRQAPFQPEQAPFQPGQAHFQPEQAAHQPERAAYQPERPSFEPRSAATYAFGPAASQPGPAAAHQREHAAYHSGQAAYHSGQAAHQPEQAAFQSGQAAYQPEQAANRFGQAAYQPEHPQGRLWAMERPCTSADPVGLLQKQHHSQLSVSVADSHQESWQTSDNAGFGGERPLQMTMNSPTLGTHHYAAASHHNFAVEPCPLPASPSGLQQSAALEQYPLHHAQHAEHNLKYPQHIPQHAQHVSEQAQRAPQQAQHVLQQAQHVPQQPQHVLQQAQHFPQQEQHVSLQTQHVPQQARHVTQQAQHVPEQAWHVPQQAQHVPQQALHVPQQARHVPQHVPQQALRVPQQAQHVPQQAQHVPQQGLQVLHPDDHANRQPHLVTHSRPLESMARSDSMLLQHAQHGSRGHDVSRHAGYAEHKVRHLLPTSEYLAEQEWQARGPHDGPPVFDDHGQWSPVRQWEDPGSGEQDNPGYLPLTEEEAEWEWRRQLAEQEESEEDDRYDDDQPMLHAPDGYDDQYPPLSPRAPWPAQPLSEEWQGAYDSHQHPMGPDPYPHAAANFQRQPGQLHRPLEQQAPGEQHDRGGQVLVGEGQRRRHRRGGRHRRPMLAAYPGAAPEPTTHPAGSTAAVFGSHFAEDKPSSHAEFYGGQSRDNVRTGSLGTLRRHSRGATDPRGNAVHARGSTVDPRGSAAAPRGGGQRAAARGRGHRRKGRSAGRSTGHTQQTRGSHSPQQPVSVSSRNWVEPALWPKGKHVQHGSNQGPHRQSRRPENKADVATFLCAQQSGYPC